MLARRTGLDDLYDVPCVRLAFFVMSEELRPLGDDPLVQGVRDASADFDNDRLLHLGPGNYPDLGLSMPDYFYFLRLFRFLCHFHSGLLGTRLLLSLCCLDLFLSEQGQHARPILPEFAHLIERLALSHGELKTESKSLLRHLLPPVLKFIGGQVS
jgi:hypothetical protein